MSSRVCSLSTATALVAAVLALALWPSTVDRPTPRLPVASISAARAAPPPGPPTALEIPARAEALALRHGQMARLRVLGRLWEGRERGLEGAIRDSERELSAFMRDAQASRSTGLHQIQQRSVEFSELSATLREERRRHSEEALRVLDGWQRQRLARVPGSVARRDR